jgi:predicted ATPase
MITRIEIDGFKTFKNFRVDLAPFQVIIGPNGSGKSNLFDALQLLSRLATYDVLEAFQGLRGEVNDLFTKYATQETSDKLRFAAEFLLDRKVGDETLLDSEVTLEYTRLRYELEMVLHRQQDDPDQLEISYEALKVIPSEEDIWQRKYGIHIHDKPPRKNFVDHVLFSQQQDERGLVTTQVYIGPIDAIDNDYNKNGPRNAVKWVSSYSRQIRTALTHSTLIKGAFRLLRISKSGGNELAYNYALAVRDAFRKLRFLHLNPQTLRQPSSIKAPRTLAFDGSNLPTTLAHMQSDDKYVLSDLSRDMIQLVPGIRNIQVKRDRLTDRYSIQVEMADHRVFSAHVLSDGTLRLLALATLKNDAQFHGILCMEEPENGVDSLHLKNLLQLLLAMSTNFKDPTWEEKPLRQVIITTHSPMLIGLPEATHSLLFALKVNHIEPGKEMLQVTRMIPVATSEGEQDKDKDRDRAMEIYTIDEVRKYLDSGNLNDALKELDKARNNLL